MSDKNSSGDPFSNRKFDVEHAISMYAYSYVSLPAWAIYESDMLEQHKEIIDACHIYMIGYAPSISLLAESLEDNVLTTSYSVLGENHELKWQAPHGAELKEDGDRVFLQDAEGNTFWPNDEQVVLQLGHLRNMEFNVKYIGQAYGKDGSRNALDRLLSHETLQKISLRGVPDGYQLRALLVQVQPNNQIVTQFNPRAEIKDSGDLRIRSGLDKLFGTDEKERVSLYEAAMIRYFQPEFNKEFKNSFPSTNLTVLQDCYGKDFTGVVGEFYLDPFPFQLCSEKVESKVHHIAYFDLHKASDRKSFFSI